MNPIRREHNLKFCRDNCVILHEIHDFLEGFVVQFFTIN